MGDGWTSGLNTIFTNIANASGPLQLLITGFAYLMGLGLIFRGIFYMKLYGEARIMSPTHTSMKQPITFLAVGAALIFFPTTVDVLMTSTFGTTEITPLSNFPGFNFPGSSSLAYDSIFKVVQLIGLISFIRGWNYFAKGASQGAQPNMFGKGMTHVIGGLLAMNISGTASLLTNSFGFG